MYPYFHVIVEGLGVAHANLALVMADPSPDCVIQLDHDSSSNEMVITELAPKERESYFNYTN